METRQHVKHCVVHSWLIHKNFIKRTQILTYNYFSLLYDPPVRTPKFLF